MRFMWGDDGVEFTHDEPADHPGLLVLAALLFFAWVFFAPAAFDRELANDEAQERRHRAVVERMAPSQVSTLEVQ